MVSLESARLVIRDNLECDLQGLFELTIDPENMRFMKSTKIDSIQEAEEHLRVAIEESKNENRMKYYFAIINKDNEEYIGAIGYDVKEKIGKEKLVELGYFIKKEHWGKGYVTEAGKKVMEYAFKKDNVVKMEASCLKENYSSEKVLIKLGMKKEGELKKHQYHEVIWKDRLLYGITKEEISI